MFLNSLLYLIICAGSLLICFWQYKKSKGVFWITAARVSGFFGLFSGVLGLLNMKLLASISTSVQFWIFKIQFMCGGIFIGIWLTLLIKFWHLERATDELQDES